MTFEGLWEISVALTPEQAMVKVSVALEKERSIPKYQMWYVQVGDRQVPITWVVKQLTGLPVSAFHTNEAKRVLQQLGIEVYSRL